MKDNLLDLIEYTYGLGIIDLVKIVGTAEETEIGAIAEDKSVVVSGKTKTPVAEFIEDTIRQIVQIYMWLLLTPRHVPGTINNQIANFRNNG